MADKNEEKKFRAANLPLAEVCDSHSIQRMLRRNAEILGDRYPTEAYKGEKKDKKKRKVANLPLAEVSDSHSTRRMLRRNAEILGERYQSYGRNDNYNAHRKRGFGIFFWFDI